MKIAMPVSFDEKTVKYKDKQVMEGQELRGSTNPDTWQLLKEGYVVLRNYIPKEIITMTLDTWKTIEAAPYTEQILQLEEDIIQDSPEETLYKSAGGYCTPFGVGLHHWLRNKLRDTIDLNLRETYSYSRKYERGAYLKAHSDRPSCEISATLCLGYRTDDNTPWKIWVDNSRNWVDCVSQEELYNKTQATTNRQRKAKGMKVLSLEPGDVLMYLGPNVAHWRDKLLGDFSYHMFLHFYNRDSELWRLPVTLYDDFAEAFDYAKPVAEKALETLERGKWGETLPLEFDGRRNRYAPDKEGSEHADMFEKFNDIWHTVRSEGALGGKLSRFTNNYESWEYDEKANDGEDPFGKVESNTYQRPSEISPDYTRPQNSYPEPTTGG